MGKNVHVTPKEGKWQVKLAGETEAKFFETKKEAVAYGITLGKEQKSELLIHNKDGKISEKNSYGNDPRGTKG